MKASVFEFASSAMVYRTGKQKDNFVSSSYVLSAIE
jgi:hypothetical protein